MSRSLGSTSLTSFPSIYAQTLNFNPRPPCGGRQQLSAEDVELARISIHVLRVEDDLPKGGQTMKFSISIHVLRVEDDGERCPALAEGCKDFTPRPPCGGRLSFRKYEIQGGEFQSTSSVWRTTEEIWLESEKCFISIHVLRVEDDAGLD